MLPKRRKWVWSSVCRLTQKLGLGPHPKYVIVFDNGVIKASVFNNVDVIYLCEYCNLSKTWTRTRQFDSKRALLKACNLAISETKQTFIDYDDFEKAVVAHYAEERKMK